MKNIKITPSELKGEVNIPPSKSMSHRAIICASLSEGISNIDNVDFSDDIIATLEGMKSLGVEVLGIEKDKEKSTSKVIIKGKDELKVLNDTIDCFESGSTIRFLIPIATLANEKIKVTGRGRLVERPMDTYYKIFEKQNIKYETTDGKIPVTIEGKIKPDTFEMEGNISSQFITGLLFTLPLLNEDSKIVITTELESKGYVDLTIDVLKKFGIEIENKDYKEFYIRGNQKYKARDYKVEGDYSQVAFWIVGGILNGDIKCNGLDLESLQGDKVVLEIVKKMGANIITEGDSVIVKKSKTKGTVIDASECPDIIPILSVLASVSEGETRVINGKRLRIKESDRLNSTATILNELGADVEELEDGLIIRGVEKLKGGVTLDSWGDHRIAMALGIASTICEEPIIITNSHVVAKSYPNFWEDFTEVGGKINEWNMG
ncbi:3-phosphoshikimate 1-carboxyvinyltransferase AroA [Gottschalkia acidurici 9a]|uniref:3-phosphoshikimate 1-carboxyvinyltransferase n=1 Tax=Gottschalkia acidurici (strain ATCC 7906 / DSM 604 / BCRC 14475 / CIP 104303 / KCTC 5404 / NCIMB 10678 / 9a) TaxID=1128398 RepID=K0AZM3_GOTA9|nr:3-phosphoshikimate 1-carboxyvinyltransferase [Gottschalkia acidurici]AFS78232.1 3-phosphoshikimate 1-carboxyvinyltransferase AroA [Gottschalkia acidurici 9a]